jgi:RimJ/RimL family protein N-acetyltransferase
MQGPYRIDLDGKAHLRVLAEHDVTPDYVRSLNDPVVHRFLVGPRSQTQTIDSVRGFVRRNVEDPASLLFGLFVSDTLRGTVRLHDIRAGGAFLGLAVFDRALWGQGWGTRCVRAATRFAREELNVSRVAAVIETDNAASLKVFDRAGYRCAAEPVVQDGACKQLWIFPEGDNPNDFGLETPPSNGRAME